MRIHDLGRRSRPTIGLALAVITLAPLISAGPARAQDLATATQTTTGSTSISAPAALSVTQNLTFTINPATVNTGLTISSASTVGSVNANFALTGGQTTSISVPATFDVTRVGGTESITVRTVAPAGDISGGASQVSGVASGSIFSQPVTVVGNLDSGQLSFSVGGAITVANNLAPGEYQGVLTVVAQYN